MSKPTIPTHECLHDLIARHARQTPDLVSLVWGEQQVTYGALDERTNRLASFLRARGLPREARVGLYLDRSIEMVEAMIGVLKAGGAYVGLDRRFPRERLEQLFRDSSLELVITQRSLAADLPDGVARVLIDDEREAIARSSSTVPGPPVDVDNLAQVIYTSGSSGQPKGVLVPHRTVLGFARGVPYLEDVVGDTYFQHSSISWDAVTLELWLALAGGGRSVLYAGQVPTLAELATLIPRHQVTALFLTASVFNLMIDTHPEALRSVRRFFTGSETVSASHVQRATRLLPDVRIFNGYGPAECGVFSTCYEVPRDATGSSVPIGRPVGHQRVYVLDARRHRVPIGATGDIHVAGPVVGRGYWGQPGLTAERFVPDPFSRVPGARMYRTGDLGRHRSDGDLDFLGRGDTQVKVRGYRIELGEIETALRHEPSVQDAAVVTRTIGAAGPQLVAYIVRRGSVDTNVLRRALRARLPEYMVPGVYVVLDAFPLNANGKLDRRALPAPPAMDAEEYVAPRTAVEELLAGIWADVIGDRVRVGVTENFFELGGHSLLAIQAVARIREVLRIDVPLRWMFESPTVATLAAKIEASGPTQTDAAIPRVERTHAAPLPLSYAQQRLWILDRLQSGQAVYNVPMAVRWRGTLNASALETALTALVARHEALRTRFVPIEAAASNESNEIPMSDDGAAQVVDGPWPMVVPIFDLRAEDERTRAARLRDLRRAEAAEPFDLSAGRLLRARIVRLTDAECVLFLTLHHIVSDGWSMGVLVNELSALYAGALRGDEVTLPPLPIQYADYAAWQRGADQTRALDAHLDHWRERLSDAPVLALPTDAPRTAVEDVAGAMVQVVYGADRLARLHGVCRREGVTLHMLLLAAYAIVLTRWSRQRDVVIGSPVAGRTRPETLGLIGFLVNTLPLRVRVDAGVSVRTLLASVREECLAAYAHQAVPFERLVEALVVARDPSRPPLVQALLNVQAAAAVGEAAGEGAGLQSLEDDGTAPAKFEVTLNASERRDNLVLRLEYRKALFNVERMRRMLADIEHVLDAMALEPAQPVASLPWIGTEEREELRRIAAGPASASTGRRGGVHEQGAHEQMAAQAAITPDAVALVFEDEAITYAALDRRVTRLARVLRRAGVGPEVRVGLCLERSIELVIAILATLRAGGTYVPLEPEYPSARLAALIADAQPAHILVQGRHRVQLGAVDVPLTIVDRVDEAGDGAHDDRARDDGEAWPRVEASQACYMIYTSGSTGQPKGAVNVHEGLRNRLDWMQDAYPIGAGDVVLQKTPFSFDVSVWEFLWPLMHGATLVVARPGGHRDPAYLADLIDRTGVTTLHFVPSMLEAFVAHAADRRETGRDAGRPSGRSLLQILCSGEALSPALAARTLTQWPAALHNLYGPTEASIDVTAWTCTHDELTASARAASSVPLGHAIARTQVYVLDDEQQLVPIGVTGEIALAGVGLGRGYWRRPDLTADRFVPNPHCDAPGARLYRTGDLGRYRADGVLEFLGRRDTQVKIRGHRIELGEIEAALRAQSGVQDAVVVVRPDAGGPRLVAYVAMPGAAVDMDAAALRRVLVSRLPDHMLPAVIVPLDEFPVTAHGKLDRRALPEPPMTDLAAGEDAPRTAIEALLTGIFASVLGRDRIGIHDNFFELGGHSLLAIRVAARVRDVLRVDVPLRLLFDAPTVARLAPHLEQADPDAIGTSIRPVPRDIQAEGEALPLSFEQQRLWVLDQLQPGQSLYNVPVATRLRGPLDVDALAYALGALVRRHEALRTRFVAVDGQAAQVVDAPWDVPLPVSDWRVADERTRTASLAQWRREESSTPFDLASGRLLRARMARTAEDEHVLLLTLHHIISDAWSLDLMVRELRALYAARLTGEDARLPELPVQYADYAAWQRGAGQIAVQDAQIAYWRTQLADAPVLALPTSGARPAMEDTAGACARRAIDAPLLTRLRAACRREGVTLHMFMLSAFAVVLTRWSQHHEVIVGTPIAGRLRPETLGVMGFFVNTLPLRVPVSSGARVRDLLASTRDVCLAAYAHQAVPFERLIDALGVARDPSRPPLVQALLNVQPAGSVSTGSGPGLALDALDAGDASSSRFEIALNANEGADEMLLRLEYRTSLFGAEQVQRLLIDVERVLDAMTDAPGRRVSALPWLDASEHAMMCAWSTGPRAQVEGSVLADIVAQAVRRPDAIAVTCGPEAVTYRALIDRAGGVARMLRTHRVAPESRIGICLERSIDQIVAILAVWQAGGAYVPLDQAHPPARIVSMTADAGLAAILTHAEVRERLPRQTAPILSVDALTHAGRVDSDVRCVMTEAMTEPASHDPRSLAYIIYTSGSTGVPKGVAVTHGGVRHLVAGQIPAFGVTPASRVLQYASVGFDASVSEIGTTLASGAALELIADADWRGGEELEEVLRVRGIDVVTLPPSVLRGLDPARVPALKTVVSAGEACSAEIASRWRGGRRFINAYGPTEITVCATLARMDEHLNDRGDDPSIGRPLPNAQAYVLDADAALVPAGVTGELYVGGAGVARGYVGQPALTASRFVPDPFGGEPGARLYRTGDRCRWRADGTLEYVGRADAQVKLRGQRIELGEIEAVLRLHDAVQDAVALVREDTPGHRTLVAYSVCHAIAQASGPPVDVDTATLLQTYLRERLPQAMVPAAIITLDALPLTVHGKVDRAALPAPERDEAMAGAEPRTPAEAALAEIWMAVLGQPRVGIHENFFELGGDSILTLQVVSRARQRGLRIDARQIFERPTIAALAAAADEMTIVRPADSVRARYDAESRVASDDMPRPARALLEAWRREGRPVEDVYRLSPLQAGMVFHSIQEPESGLYFEQSVCDLDGALDADALWGAWRDVLARHAVLRTAFVWEGLTEPVQVVYRDADVTREEHDWQTLAPEEQARRFDAFLAADRARGWRLDVAPLWRLALLRLAPDRWRLVWSQHHVLLDGWSLPVLLDEVWQAYAARLRGTTAPWAPVVPYRDYLAWLDRQDLAAAEAWWRDVLRGCTEPTPLPGARRITGRGPRRYVEHTLALSAEQTGALERWARRQHVTLSTLVQGLWALFVSRATGARDVIYGLTIAGRPADVAGADRMVGLLINTVPMRVAVPSAAAPGAWLRDVQTQQAAAQQYGYAPLSQVQGWSVVPAGRALFDTLVIFENYPRTTTKLPAAGAGAPGTGAPGAGGGREHEREHERELRVDLSTGLERTNYPVTLAAAPGARLTLKLTIDVARVDEEASAAWLPRLARTMEALIAGVDRVGALATDDDAVPADWMRGASVAAASGSAASGDARMESVAARIALHAGATPDAVAIAFEREALTYGALRTRVRRLARELRAHGVGPEVRVGVCFERSIDLVVALLAVWEVGGAYVPLAPADPVERLAWVMADAGVRVLITPPRWHQRLAAADVHTIAWSAAASAADDTDVQAADDEGPARVAPEQLAYVLYTSGSTGRPKGVLVTHGGLSHYLTWAAQAYDVASGWGAPVASPVAFDLTVTCVFSPLLAGRTIALVREGDELEGLARLLRTRPGASLLKITPAHLDAVSRLLEEDPGPGLLVYRLIIGGEALHGETLRLWRTTAPHVRIVNEYGPTETVVGCCVHDRAAGEIAPGAVPIGQPIASTQLYVMDDAGALAPIGVTGELFIGGAGVARGYGGRPALTAERFVPDAYGGIAGARLYRTGDRCRWRADGALEYVGRTDQQVKVRGHRIELGEIEAVLRQHPSLADAVAVVREDTPGHRRLTAYVVLRERTLDAAAVQAFLRDRLPAYMIPSSVVSLDALPQTNHGKVDRAALPAPVDDVVPADAAPRTPTEAALAEIWAAVLGRDRVGIHDNFFELGGDSILSLQIVSRARDRGLRVSARQVFEQPTIASLAAAQDAEEQAGGEQGIVSGEVALTPIQRWFVAQALADPSHWNQAVLLTIAPHVDAAGIRAALVAITVHHDALRMRFEPAPDGWRQVNLAEDDASTWWSEVDVATAADVTRAAADLQARLDLVSGPVQRAACIRVGADGSARLLWAIHHLVVDGVSWRVLLEDLARAYEQWARGEAIALPAKSASLRQWASALTTYGTSAALRAQELTYWIAQAASDTDERAAVPVDKAGGENTIETNTTATADRVGVSLSASDTQALVRQAPMALRATVEEILLAAAAHAYGEWSGQPEIAIALEGHGREEARIGADVARTVGWFTTLYPVRLPARGTSTAAVLPAVSRRLRAVPSRGIGYGLLRYVAGAPELADVAPEISFNYLGQWDSVLADGVEPASEDRTRENGDRRARPFGIAPESPGPSSSPRNRRAYVLEISAYIHEGKLRLFWGYSTDLHRRASIQALADRSLASLRTLLQEAAHVPELTAAAAGAANDEVDGSAGRRVTRRTLDVLRRQLTKS